MTEQYPHVLYYAPGSRANRANRAAAVSSAVHEMVACRLLPDPHAHTETCDMQTEDSAKQKTDGSAKQKSDTRKRMTEEIVQFTCVADAQQALQALQSSLADDADDTAADTGVEPEYDDDPRDGCADHHRCPHCQSPDRSSSPPPTALRS